MHRFFNRWHPLIGIVVAVPVLLWGLSGLTHPLMRLLRPAVDEAALTRAPIAPPELAASPVSALQKAGVKTVSDLRTLRVAGRLTWRTTTPTGVRYFDAATGIEDPGAGEHFAIAAARAYAQEPVAAVRSVTLVTAFTDEYRPINKLLPAWRVEFDRPDNLRIYLAADDGQFVTAFDVTRATLNTVFGWFHTWDFIDEKNPWRIGLTFFFMTLMAAAGLSGMVLYALGRRARNRPPLRAWHRGVGFAVSLATLMFSVSGALHVTEKLRTPQPRLRAAPLSVAVEQLQAAPVTMLKTLTAPTYAITLSTLDGAPAWRFAQLAEKTGDARMVEHHDHGEQAHESHWPARWFVANGAPIPDGEARRARELVTIALPEARIAQASPVTQFGGDYGFINKRLPVVRVDLADETSTRHYVDVANGQFMARADNRFDLENWTFRYLHKWHFADALGLNGRDALIAAFVVGNVIVAGLGTVLYVKRRRRPAVAGLARASLGAAPRADGPIHR